MRALSAVVLASASPRRRELLSSLGLDVVVRPTGAEEGERPGLAPLELARAHARSKAEILMAQGFAGLGITADTVVDIDGRALNKPADEREARTMLRALSGREHLVHTAYVLCDGEDGRRLERSRTTRVRFYPLDDATIDAYVATGEPMDKAGAYGIQGRGATLVESIDGDFYTVMGFPLGDFVQTIAAFGYALETNLAVTR
jgi:septum formation protein